MELENNAQTIGGQVGKVGIDINALAAWTLTKGSKTVKVGIVDTGIDIEHSDLKDSIYVNPNDPVNGIDDDGNGYIDDDGNGYIDDKSGWDFASQDRCVYDGESQDTHGTHVAGVIGAGLNGMGISGISPEVKIIPAKFINGTTGFTSDAIEAIQYLEKMDVAIVNCSWGSAEYSPVLYDVMKNSKMLFVAAAGNAGKNTDSYSVYPACFELPNVIAVSAIDNKGNLASYSNYGSRIDIAAPGTNIISTLPGNKYGMLSGTSMAAPAISGVAVLLKSLDASIDTKGIKARLENNVNKLSSLTGKISTSGSLNAYAALINTAPENIEITEPDQNTETNGAKKSKEPEPVCDASLEANNKVMKPLGVNNNLFVDSLINKESTNTASSDNGIQNLKMSIIKGRYITVTWTTQKESSSELIYGQTEELGQSVVYKEMTTKHQITVNPEDLDVFGYYKVRSITEDGTVYESQTVMSSIPNLNEVITQETSEATQEAVENNTQSNVEDENEQNNNQNEAQNISAFSYITDNGANHSKTNAQAIAEGTVFGIMESQTYDDYYALNLESGKTYTIDLKGIAVGEDYDLKLIDGSSFALGISANEENYDESITYTATYTGVHYIIAQSYTVLSTSAHHNYQLMFYSTQNKVDTYEPNDSKDSATVLQNGVAIEPTININSDDDWFVLDATKIGKLSVSLNSVPANCDFDLEIYKDGEYLGGSYLSSNKDEKVDKLITSTGKYYIRVYSCIGSDSVNNYKLKAGVYTPDGYEVNDDLYSVKNNNASVAINNWVTATIDNPDDIDGYKFTIGSDTKVGIRLQNIPSGMDYDVVLYSYSNYQFTEISRSTFGGNTDELISSQLVSGTYYVKVYSYLGSSETSGYKLNIYDENKGIISLEIDKTTAAVGDIITAVLMVDRIQNLAGFQANIKYDPMVLQPLDFSDNIYESWTDPMSGTLINSSKYSPMTNSAHDLENGILNFGNCYLNLSAYRNSGVAETNGSLAIIRFRVIRDNQIQIRFEGSASMPGAASGVSLFDWDGNNVYGYVVNQPQVVNEVKTVNVQSVSSCSSEEEGFALSPFTNYEISGCVVGDNGVKQGFKVQIYKSDNMTTPIKTTDTDSTGCFVISDFSPVDGGKYKIFISKSGFLKREISDIEITGAIVIGTIDEPVELWRGDIDNDDVINMVDVISCAKSFNSIIGNSNYNAACDLNDDGNINMADVIIIAKYFNSTPTSYSKAEVILHSFTDVEVSNDATVALKADGSVWRIKEKPVKIIGFTNAKIFRGVDGVRILNGDGTLWGCNNREGIVKLEGINGIKKIIGGRNEVYLLENGSVYLRGKIYRCNSYMDELEEVKGFPPEKKIVDVALGNNYGLALMEDGTVWSWGYNFEGQMGITNEIGTNAYVSPTQIPGLFDIKSIAAFNSVSFAIGDEYVWCWGGTTLHSEYLFLSMTKPDFEYTSMPKMYSMSNVKDISVEHGRAVATKYDGSVWTWGYNNNEQSFLGLGSYHSFAQTTPVKIETLSDVKKVAIGRCMTAALKNDGSIWTWGQNFYGMLGVGYDGGKVYTPTKVVGGRKYNCDLEYIYIENNNIKRMTLFSADALEYTIPVAEMPEEIFVKTVNNNAEYELGYVSGQPSVATIKVTDGEFERTYKINFVKAPSTGDSSSKTLSAKGNIEHVGEIDYYKFKPESSKVYTICSEGSTDVVIDVYDGQNNLIASNDDDGVGNNFYLEISLKDSENYHIKVSHFDRDNGIGGYTLNIIDGAKALIADGEAYLEDVVIEAGGEYLRETNQVKIGNEVVTFNESNCRRDPFNNKLIVNVEVFIKSFPNSLVDSVNELDGNYDTFSESVGTMSDELTKDKYLVHEVSGFNKDPLGKGNNFRIQTVLDKLFISHGITGYYRIETSKAVKKFKMTYMGANNSTDGFVNYDTALQFSKYYYMFLQGKPLGNQDKKESWIKPQGVRVREYLTKCLKLFTGQEFNGVFVFKKVNNRNVLWYNGHELKINKLEYLSSESKCYATISDIERAVEEYNLTTHDYSISSMTKHLQDLVNAATKYKQSTGNSDPVNRLALNYIRRGSRYNHGNWPDVAGKLNQEFISYVNGGEYQYLAGYFYDNVMIKDPLTNIDVDFVHFAATLSGITYTTDFRDASSIFGTIKDQFAYESDIDNLAGWAGDLQTLLKEVKSATNNSDNYNTIYNKTIELLSSGSIYFPIGDVYADTDAVNIKRIMSDYSENIAFAFNKYYNGDNKARYVGFVKGLGNYGTDNYSKELIYKLSEKYTNPVYIGPINWPLLKGVSATDNQIKAVARAFVDFIWSKIEWNNPIIPAIPN